MKMQMDQGFKLKPFSWIWNLQSMTWRIAYKCNASRTYFSCGFQLSVARQGAQGAFCFGPTDVLPRSSYSPLSPALEGAVLLGTHNFPPNLHVHGHQGAAKACVWSLPLFWTWKASSQMLSRQAWGHKVPFLHLLLNCFISLDFFCFSLPMTSHRVYIWLIIINNNFQ